MDRNTIGRRLRYARMRAVLTQDQLAEKSKVPVITISRIENDQFENAPRQTTIQKLASALNVEPGWLMFGEDLEKAAA